jgi:glycosyltransferase involved in cell wall biosynthesis
MSYKIFDNSLHLSGNESTLTRLSHMLNLDMTDKIEDNIIGIHAYKFGKLVIDKNINYILILGGTDINEYMYQEEYRDIIEKALINARYIVSFNQIMKEKIIKQFDTDSDKIKIIPQSIEEPIETKAIDIKHTLNLYKYSKIFIVVGHLRKVKDPEFLFKDVNSNYAIVFIGNMIEGHYTFPSNVFHIDGLVRSQIYYIMKHVDGLINCSKSEGMSMSILEAMVVKCPVYARNIEGNTAIIKNGYNGFIFNTTRELNDIIELNNDYIIKNAYRYVNRCHHPSVEKEQYNKIIKIN